MTHDASYFTDKVNELAMHDGNYTMLIFFDQLAPAEQALVGIWELCQEVQNGGFFQYMHNSSGEHALTTGVILKKIGADRFAFLVEEAMNIVDGRLRSMNYHDAYHSLPQEKKDRLYTMDQELYSHDEQLNGLLLRYLMQCRDELAAPDGFWEEIIIQ
jgi:hypothetical protein